MRRAVLTVLAAGATLSCATTATSVAGGGAATALRRPVEKRCESVGLRGCDDMVEGVLLYALRNPAEGEQALSRGVSANLDNPEKLRAFASALVTLQKVPGVGQYIEPIRPALEVLKSAADNAMLAAETDGEAAVASAGTNAKSGASEPDATPQGAPAAPKTPAGEEQDPRGIAALKTVYSGFVEPAGDPHARACRLGNIPGRCIASVPGRRLIEQLYVSSACTNDMFVQRGPTGDPKWVIHVPAGEGLQLTEARLPVEQGDFLVFGSIGADGDPPASDSRCGISWVAMGPPKEIVQQNPYR